MLSVLLALGSPPTVVATQEVMADPAWRAVAESMAPAADIVVWGESGAEGVRAALASTMPRYTVFVSKPDQSGREFVADIHQLTRALDADLWCDTRWGIVTGRSPADAMRLASTTEPISVRVGFGGTGIPLDRFTSGCWFNEGAAGERTTKSADGAVATTRGETDTTTDLVAAFNSIQPDFMMTSGHATEGGWEMGYSFPAGSLQPRDGSVVGVDRKGGLHPIESRKPKVFLAAGNCLLGHVNGPDALALALMGETAGFDQLVGYTVVTWAGHGGWGTKDWFFADPGRYSLHEAFWLNNQMILEALDRDVPGSSKASVPGFGKDDPNALFRTAGAALPSDWSREQVMAHLGRLWDRDGVAFYGRPDRDARLSRGGKVWDSEIDDRGSEMRVTVFAPGGATLEKPPAVFLPRRIAAPRVVDAGGLADPLVADDFVVFRGLTDLPAGERRTIVIADDSAVQVARAAVPSWGSLLELSSKFPAAYRGDLVKAFSMAEANQGEIAAYLEHALDAAATDPLAPEAAGFLVANMPERDLVSLRAEMLVEHLDYALRTRRESKWSKDIPVELWLDAVMPYAHVNERRDQWRKDYYERFFATTQAPDSIEQVALALNQLVFKDQNVVYHATKRPKSNQSPYESRDAGYASCTGLSVMLADALRTGGIPARLAGTPLWLEKTGNHTWVEAWDGTMWRPVEAFSEQGFSRPWWAAQAAALAAAGSPDPMHRLYASGWKHRPSHFVQAWSIEDASVPGDDVTAAYANLWSEDGSPAPAGPAPTQCPVGP
ncbi:MAG: transglutaminase-like domain-containing protein [Planctomycetota bacterium]|nr:transglutaminase-like domain-containing protein [Planctomycetota bacterium]MDA1106320.1 transglutaminase-like domain-containing protein [Planctomycetota bacterium]